MRWMLCGTLKWCPLKMVTSLNFMAFRAWSLVLGSLQHPGWADVLVLCATAVGLATKSRIEPHNAPPWGEGPRAGRRMRA
jgi:hypothetical protein